MSRNKYKNNEPLNRKAAPEESDGREQTIEPGPTDEPLHAEGVDPEKDPRQDDLKTRMPEEEPEVVEEVMDRDSEKPLINPAMADTLAKPDYREHHLHLEASHAAPQDPEKHFAADQMNKMDKTGSDAPRDTRPTRAERRGSEPRKGFPWWWILLPLILLALIYGLTRNPTPPADGQDGSTTRGLSSIVLMSSRPVSHEIKI